MPTDMSQCVYAVTKKLIFAVAEDEVEGGSDVLAVIMQRQFSYFADEDGFDGLLKHLGDSPWCEMFRVVHDSFDETHPLMPVSMWKGHNIDADFRDLVSGLTNFDPARRITAHEALAHRWFADVGKDE
jgi:serine/threonine protein kinase